MRDCRTSVVWCEAKDGRTTKGALLATVMSMTWMIGTTAAKDLCYPELFCRPVNPAERSLTPATKDVAAIDQRR